MAAVTQNGRFGLAVLGNQRLLEYNITIANNGDTLVTPLRKVYAANSNDTAISKISVNGGTLTFTTSGPVSGALVSVIGL
jgi:hypothetical protein